MKLCFLSKGQDNTAISVKISNFLICFCSFDFFCPIFEKENVTENVHIVLSY